MSMSTLIVGDGNFSFSCAMIRAGKLPHAPSGLTATSYDSKEVLLSKYGKHAASNVEELEKAGCRVLCNVDATNLQSTFSAERSFDSIIFQHPLIDANDRREKAHAGMMGAKEDYIIANRLLVLDFLLSAESLLRKSDGEIRVTVKDVHPYTLWRVARLQLWSQPLVLKRKEAFINSDFPGYETLNVETNHSFPSETATTYIFGFGESEVGKEQVDPMQSSLIPRGKGEVCDKMMPYLPFRCNDCNKFFTSSADQDRHIRSRKHGVLAKLEQKWTALMVKRFSCEA